VSPMSMPVFPGVASPASAASLKISSSCAQTSKAAVTDAGRHRCATSAVVIRRALELLTNLCKNEKPMAEAIIAVSQSDVIDPFPVAACPSSSPSTQPSRVSALVRLLSEPLFKRSTLHQEQLLLLLTTVCNAIPPGRAPAKALVSKMGANVEEVANIEEAANAEIVDSMDHDMHSASIGPDDLSLAEIHGTADGDSSGDKVIESKGGAEEEDVVVPVKYRVPSLRNEDIQALTDVLLQGGASERTYHRATTVLGQFGMLPSNRARSLAALSESASRLGDAVASAFKIFVSSLPSAAIESSSDSRALAVQEFSMAASDDELTFLRIAKAVSVLVKGVVDFKPSISAQAVEGVVQDEELSEEARMDYEIELDDDANSVDGHDFRQSLVGLDSLWTSLGAVLDEVQQQSAKDDASMTEANL
jgi:hypothetical protein